MDLHTSKNQISAIIVDDELYGRENLKKLLNEYCPEVKIIDLAKSMIHLAGLEVMDDDNPGGDIEIKYVGLRPGEKLYEELLIGENVSGTIHPKIMRAEEVSFTSDEMDSWISELQNAVSKHDHEKIMLILKQTVNGFAPREDIVDYGYNYFKNSRAKDSADLKLH